MAKRSSYTARALLTTVALVTGIVPFFADYNETHVFNPLWPGHLLTPNHPTCIHPADLSSVGHAKFHNAQTMSLGIFLGLTTLWKTWLDNPDHCRTACVLASGYYLTMLSSWYFPGVTAWDPPQYNTLEFPQLTYVVVPMLSLVASAFGLEMMGWL